MSTDYGYGLTVNWTPKEKEKINEYRVNAAVRRMFGLGNDNRSNMAKLRQHPELSAKMKELMREVWATQGDS